MIGMANNKPNLVALVADYDNYMLIFIFNITITMCTSGGSSMLSPISSITSEAKLSSTTSRRRCTCRV